MKKEKTSTFNNRLKVYQIFLILLMAAVIVKLFFIAVGQHGYYKALAENQHSFFQKLLPNRGEIFVTDKYSQTPYAVATNAQKNLVYAVPQDVVNALATAHTLSGILSINEADLLPKLTDKSKQYVPLAHYLSDDQAKQVSDAKLQGIYLNPENVRYYPEGQFLSQVLGFLGYKDSGTVKVGLYGIEKYFEQLLAGKPGSLSTEADNSGNWITGSPRDFVPAQDGESLLLTIDRSIQHEAESVLQKAVSDHGADSGSVIVANPKTGAILAMADYPSFDPNQYNQASSPANYLNLATTENYEPGSTMKAVTLSAALDLGLITPDSTFNDTGEVDVDGFKIKNSDGKGHGLVTMTQVIDHSLNTGAVYVEQQLGNVNFLNYIKKFGFGKETGIELPENIGDITNLNKPIQVNYDTASFGQGITVTPIQMLQAYMAMANGGVMMQPYIVDSQITADGKTIQTKPVSKGQVISQKAAAYMSAMLVDDVENGYGKLAKVPGYYIGGKTGTAQVASKGKYVANDNIGSFVGYGPVENPQFVMIVNINHPRDVNFAETTAVPAFGQIAQFILNYYQISPTRK